MCKGSGTLYRDKNPFTHSSLPTLMKWSLRNLAQKCQANGKDPLILFETGDQ